MKHKEKHIKISDYSYDLPTERIAQFPLEERDSSKLLVYKNGIVEDRIFREFPEIIDEGSLLVFNDTKVINARMFFDSGRSRPIEILLLKPFGKRAVQDAINDTGSSQWECIIGNMRKWKEKFLHKKVNVNQKIFDLSVKITERTENFFVLEFKWDTEFTFGEIIEQTGLTPLPPYMKRDVVHGDHKRYQTVYAEHEGSVAAPTAGLHFTKDILEKLKNKNVSTAELTLHVGAGTFKPVMVENIFEHKMHPEVVTFTRELIEKLLEIPVSKTVSVGTTSLRALESIYILEKKLSSGEEEMRVDQWDGGKYKVNQSEREEVLKSLLQKMKTESISFETSLMIHPGYNIISCNGLVTNFHQPRSTLLLLVAAFIDKEWKSVYNHALKNGYRFLSYGDGMFLSKNS